MLADGTRQSEELAGPAACRQIASEGTGTATFFYLNSIIDWSTNFKLHQNMVDNPAWREKNASGGDMLKLNNYMYGLEVTAMKAAWIKTCVDAVKAGCSGCFIDQANVDVAGDAQAGGATKADAQAWSAGHLAALVELSHELAATGNYPILNHFGVSGPRAKGMSSPIAMMIEVSAAALSLFFSEQQKSLTKSCCAGLRRQRDLRNEAADHCRPRLHSPSARRRPAEGRAMGRLWTGQSVRGRRYQLDGGLSRRGWAAFVLPLQLCELNSGGHDMVFGGNVARGARLVAHMAARVRFSVGRAEWASDQRAVASQPHRRGAHVRLQPTVHCAAHSHRSRCATAIAPRLDQNLRERHDGRV